MSPVWQAFWRILFSVLVNLVVHKVSTAYHSAGNQSCVLWHTHTHIRISTFSTSCSPSARTDKLDTNLDPPRPTVSEGPRLHPVGENRSSTTDFGLRPGQCEPVATTVDDRGLAGHRARDICRQWLVISVACDKCLHCEGNICCMALELNRALFTATVRTLRTVATAERCAVVTELRA